MAGGSSTILIVDDDEGIRVSLDEFLAEEGFTVRTASNGREALDMLRTGLRPSAIVVDLMMPDLNGWDFRAAQRRVPEIADIPVAVMTGFGSSPESILAVLPGVEILNKPLSLPHLLEFVRRHCGES
jgi:two-component system, chemotaxis family, chemotaxis protein CheY